MIPNARPIEMIGGMPWTLDLATLFFLSSLVMVAAIIVAYPLSITSSGSTILYVILRRKTTDENLLEVEKEEETMPEVEGKAEETDGKPEESEDSKEPEEKPE